MKEIEFNRNITRSIKCLIIAMVSLMFLVTLIPLWQIGARSNAVADYASVIVEATEIDREAKALRAAVAAGLPVESAKVVYNPDYAKDSL